jgi:hypothetical protein
MDGTSFESFKEARFGISDVESSVSATSVLDRCRYGYSKTSKIIISFFHETRFI